MGGKLASAHLHNACPETHHILFLEKHVFFFRLFSEYKYFTTKY